MSNSFDRTALEKIIKNRLITLASLVISLLIVGGCNSLSPSNVSTATAINTPIPPTPENPGLGSDGLGDLYFPGLVNGGYDVLHYLIDLEVDMDSNTIAGKTVIDIETKKELSSLNFDFLGLKISGIRVDEISADFSRAGSELSIQLPHPLNEDQFAQIEINYS